MEFGKIELTDLEEIKFVLPSDTPSTIAYLQKNEGRHQTRVFLGCSKWGHKEWVGHVFPEGTHESEFLDIYTEKYEAIELDTTYYNIQRKNVLKVVDAVKGKDFKVCPKFNRRISHAKSFNEVRDITEYYVHLLGQFGKNLGACILQLPEYFAQKRMDDLRYLLEMLPHDFPVNVELRNKGWFYEKEHPVFEMLRERNVGTVITATAGRRDAIHMNITNPVVIIRYVGNNLHPSDHRRLDLWAERINEWANYQALREIYFFVHHDDEAHSPATVAYMAQKLNVISGIKAKVPLFNY